MELLPRHQCVIYDGSPSKMLPVVAAQIKQMMDKNLRCLYLNSPPMVTGIQSYLYAAGIDVSSEIEKGGLVLSSENHSKYGVFDIDYMLGSLREEVEAALADGYKGLWATGDMTWELGADNDPEKLLEYERRLDKLFQEQPALSGLCQYHVNTLTKELVYSGVITHPIFFINDTLALSNPHYAPPGKEIEQGAFITWIEEKIQELCALQPKKD